MGKISVGGYDDGEGPSNRNPIPNRKRRRVLVSNNVLEDLESFIRAIDDEEQEVNEGESEEPETELHDDEDEDEEYYFVDEEIPPFAPRSNSNPHPNAGPNVRSAKPSDDDGDKSLSFKLTDPDVIDCCVCYEPLSAPVFQCENGHIACSNCCSRLGNKCPMCSMPIGYSRCRAIEKVLESIKISCLNAKLGCKETYSYSKKNDHEKECIYLPCFCPHFGCDFVASSKELSLHFRHRHVGSGIRFTYDNFFSVFLNVHDKTIVLQEQNDADLFILHNTTEHRGNIVVVSCIGPNSKPRFQYDILAKSQGWSLALQSFAKNIQVRSADTPTTGFLVIPSEFFGSSGQIKLKICIRHKSAHPADVQRS